MPRATRQRTALIGLLERTPEFRSTQQMHAVLHQEEQAVPQATVHRTLSAMAEAGDVDVLSTAGGEARYRQCHQTEHHHHLVCRICGHIVEASQTLVERWAAQTARQHGFTSPSRAIELHGIYASYQ